MSQIKFGNTSFGGINTPNTSLIGNVSTLLQRLLEKDKLSAVRNAITLAAITLPTNKQVDFSKMTGLVGLGIATGLSFIPAVTAGTTPFLGGAMKGTIDAFKGLKMSKDLLNTAKIAGDPAVIAAEKAGVQAATNAAASSALGTTLGIVGLIGSAATGVMSGLDNPDTAQYTQQAKEVGSLVFGVGDLSDLRQLATNVLYLDPIAKSDLQRSAGQVAANIFTSIGTGALSGLTTFGPWGLLAGLGTGLAAGIGEAVGAALAGKNANIINNQINAANQAASNHLAEAFRTTAEAENFLKMSAIAAEGGKLYKKGSVLDVDEEALELLKKQGYTFKILQ